jgi:hypothetical protein
MMGARSLERRFSTLVCELFVLLNAGCSGTPSSAPSASNSGGAGGARATNAGGASSAGMSSSLGGGGGGGAGLTSGGGGASGAGTGGASTSGNAGMIGSAGTSGGSAGSGGGACVTAGNELCDDFETGQIDAQKWTMPKPTASASVTLDGMQTHSGKFALHIHGIAGQINNGVIAEAVTFPAQNNSFYARIFAYFYPDLPAMAGGDFHTGFIVGTGQNALGDVQAGMGLIGGAKQFLGYSIFFGDPSFEFGPWANTKATPNQWLCLELHEDGSRPDTELRQVWVNDVELKELESDSAMAGGTAHPNHKPPAFDQVSVGLWEFHPSPTLTDMWVDDVRVSSQKIGCSD